MQDVSKYKKTSETRLKENGRSKQKRGGAAGDIEETNGTSDPNTTYMSGYPNSIFENLSPI